MRTTAKRPHLILLCLLPVLCALTIYARYGSPFTWQREPVTPTPTKRTVRNAIPTTALLHAQSGGSFNLPQTVIAGGGGSSTGGTNEITGTIGQHLTGQSSGGGFAIEGGFWPGAVPAQCPVISVTPATLPNGTIGAAYPVQNFSASGGQSPYGFTVSGALPPGLILAGNMLSGTPAATGTFPFSIIATDANQCTGSQSYSVTITCQTIVVNPSSLPSGTIGQPYNQNLSQTGAIGGVAFSISVPALPTGLSLNSGTGELSGTPTVSGSFNFTARVTDSNGCFGERAYALVIGNCPPITLSPETLPNGTVGVAYPATQLTAAGGTAPYTFAVINGTIPSGLSLTPGGLLSGTPAQTASVNLEIEVTDANGCTGSRTYVLTINPGGNGLQFYALPAPVRLLDTRNGVTGCVTNTGVLAAGSTRTEPARTVCSTIPANATAIIGNITVVPTEPGFLTLFPSDSTQPTVANSNFTAGEVTNNFFTAGLGAGDGAFKIFTSAATQVIIDVTGYYAPPSPSGLYYHPLPAPVRLLQTFPGQTGCFQNGSQQLIGQNNPNANPALDLTVDGRGAGLPSPCNGIPDDAVVLVGNATTVFPSAPLGFGYLTIYPSDAARPTVASSNYGNNDIINGPFAVKLGADGKFKVYTFSTTHLVIDISGYYSASPNDANGTGLLFNPLPSPMRLLETRNIPGFPLVGCYKPQAPVAGGTGGIRTQQVWGTCADQPIMIPNSSQAIVGNVTAINSVGAGFGTFFPGNVGTAPTVATTNYPFPVVFGYNRHYYVGLSPTDGTFKILTQFTSDYIVDVSGYFAP